MTARHTPGPWFSDPEFNHECVLGADGLLVADCAIFGRDPDPTRANARLIAAAPDLLAFVDKIARILRHGEEDYSVEEDETHAETVDRLIVEARALAAKAVGEG